MKTKMLTSVLLIALVSGLMGTGTYAYFTDSALSSSNTVTAGTLELQLTDGNPNPNAQWTMFQGFPGTACGDGDIRIHSIGSIEADHVEISFQVDGHEDNDGDVSNGYVAGPSSDTLQTGTGTMSSYLIVDQMGYAVFENGVKVPSSEIILVGYSAGKYIYNSAYLTDFNGNGFIDLDDLSKTHLDNLGAPKANEVLFIDYSQLDMCISFWDDGTPQNDFQGDVIDMTVEVTLNQDASQ